MDAPLATRSVKTPDLELRLVELAQRGDGTAFDEIYRARQGLVYRFALHMSGNRQTAEDVTQDVFLALLRQRNSFDPARGTLTAYLLGIARHHVLRTFGRRDEAPIGDGETGGLLEPAVEAEVEHVLTRDELVGQVRDAVLTLPVHYREVIVLCDLQERSYEESAHVLDVSIGTVRSRLHRARALLGQKLRRFVPVEGDAVRSVKRS